MATVLGRYAALGRGAVGRHSAEGFEIQIGGLEEYRALERFHYRCGPPATCVGVKAAVERSSGELAGVLVVSMPTLNGRWRREMWGERLCSGDKRRDAAAINAELRTISRVIVEPRYRGLGVAVELVRAYLSDPLTSATEAVAAMGWCCPFFASAGMRAVELRASTRDLRLAAVLRGEGIRAWELMEVGRAEAVLASSDKVARAVRTWGRSGGRATARWCRGVADRPSWELAVLAAGSVAGKAVAYGAG